MVALYIVAGIFLLLLLVLLLPVGVYTQYFDSFVCKIKLCGITVYKITPAPKREKKSKASSKPKKLPEKKENVFKKLQNKMGFVGAVREIFSFASDCIVHIKKLLKHIYFKKVNLNITVASEDAAKTAISYGAVCSAVYPTMALLDTSANVSFKKIDIISDFESQKCKFGFSALISLKIIYLIFALFGIYSEYKKFNARMNENERK